MQGRCDAQRLTGSSAGCDWIGYEYFGVCNLIQTFPNVPIVWIICQRRISDVKSTMLVWKFVCAWSYYWLLCSPCVHVMQPCCADRIAWFASHHVLSQKHTQGLRNTRIKHADFQPVLAVPVMASNFFIEMRDKTRLFVMCEQGEVPRVPCCADGAMLRCHPEPNVIIV